MNNIFIPVVGQFTNVGDAMHRRELISWLEKSGMLHVYVGKAPRHFVDALNIPVNSKIYQSLTLWVFAMIISPYNKTHFVFNPGEITVGAKRLIMEMFLMFFLWFVKLKKGKVLRVGIAVMANVKLKYSFFWKLILKQSSHVYWRTQDSRNLFGFGEVIPDLAFASTRLSHRHADLMKNTRYLVVSMRADRPYPSEAWFNSIKSYASKNNLQFAHVSQVRMDNERCSQIHRELGGLLFSWPANKSHNEQEEQLRTIYQNASLAVSDRLHVLIAAASEGAIPCVVLTKASDKIEYHFDVINLQKIAIYSVDEEKIKSFLDYQTTRRDEVIAQIVKAQAHLSRIRKDVYNLLLE